MAVSFLNLWCNTLNRTSQPDLSPTATLFAKSWRRRKMKILHHSWMLCCPRNFKLEEAVLEGILCTYNIALPFSNDWNYRTGPSTMTMNVFERSADRKSFHCRQNLCSQQIWQQWSNCTVTHHFLLCKIILSTSTKNSFSASHSASCCCIAKVKLLLNGRRRWFMRGFSMKKQYRN